MECRTFELILHSALNLSDVRDFGRMKVYAKVSISGDTETEFVIPADKEGETNPIWNCKINYTLAEELVQLEEKSVNVVIRLYCQRLLGDKYVGEVSMSLKSLFDSSKSGDWLCRDVRRSDGEGSFGKVCFSYRFTEKIIVEKPSRFDKILKGAYILSKVGLEIVQHLTQG